MASIELVIEGEGAISAAEVLLAESGVEGSLQLLAQSHSKDPMATVVAVVGIVAGTVATMNGVILRNPSSSPYRLSALSHHVQHLTSGYRSMRTDQCTLSTAEAQLQNGA